MSEAATHAINWDPYDQAHFKDPYPVYQALRENRPAYYNEEYGFYAVSLYQDAEEVIKDRDKFISKYGNIIEFIGAKQEFPLGFFINEDPPLHAIHRGILTRVFTPRKMAALEPQIREYCAHTLDRFADGDEIDFIEHLGAEMPMRVISMLLGIPDADQKAIQKDADERMSAVPGQPQVVERDRTFAGTPFEDYIDWRATHPSNDLMTELINANFVDETGATRKLTRGEILIFVNILAAAGNETTNRLIGWTAKLLAEHPDQRRQIYEDRSLVPQAVEEILRFEPPAHVIARYVAADSEFHGVKVPKGSTIAAIVAAANRDEAKFENGEAFDIFRERVPHLSFGLGFHNCLGNALARVEGRIALEELLKRFPEWDVDMERAHLSKTTSARGWETLPGRVRTLKSR